jgi:hypothetical protein
MVDIRLGRLRWDLIAFAGTNEGGDRGRRVDD